MDRGWGEAETQPLTLKQLRGMAEVDLTPEVKRVRFADGGAPMESLVGVLDRKNKEVALRGKRKREGEEEEPPSKSAEACPQPGDHPAPPDHLDEIAIKRKRQARWGVVTPVAGKTASVAAMLERDAVQKRVQRFGELPSEITGAAPTEVSDAKKMNRALRLGELPAELVGVGTGRRKRKNEAGGEEEEQTAQGVAVAVRTAPQQPGQGQEGEQPASQSKRSRGKKHSDSGVLAGSGAAPQRISTPGKQAPKSHREHVVIEPNAYQKAACDTSTKLSTHSSATISIQNMVRRPSW